MTSLHRTVWMCNPVSGREVQKDPRQTAGSGNLEVVQSLMGFSSCYYLIAQIFYHEIMLFLESCTYTHNCLT